MNIQSLSDGLGDTILLSSVCKYFPEKISVKLTEKVKRFGCLFKNIANIQISDDNSGDACEIGLGHYATRKLRYFFGEYADLMDNRPICFFSDDKSEIAAAKIKNGRICAIVCPTVADHWNDIGSLPEKVFQSILKRLSDAEITPIIISSGDYNCFNYEKYNNLPLETLVCLMRQCGQYEGTCTGLYHLAASVGAKINCFIPPKNNIFFPEEWCYDHPTIQHFTWQNK